MKVFVVGGDIFYINWIEGAELTDKLSKADIVFFTGGEDVDPSLYDCKKHPRTWSNIERDRFEKNIFDQVTENQLVIGVCRGSQFCCIMNGGLLVQHCNNHGIWGTHEITNGSEIYQITSTHHQMQYPYNLDKIDYDLLYWANGLSNVYEGDKINSKLIQENGEPEIVLYHKKGLPKCLAIQGHPELMRFANDTHIMLNNLIRKYGKV